MKWCPLLLDYEKIRGMVQSDDADERLEAINQIRDNFRNLTDTDKEQAWKDLLALTKDGDSEVRWNATFTLGLAFQHVTDKVQASKDLLALMMYEDRHVRTSATYALGLTFQHVTDKVQASKDLLVLTKDEDRYVRTGATYALGLAFQYVTDKVQIWNKLLTLTMDEDHQVRWIATHALGLAFQYLTDKVQAWKDLFALTMDKDIAVRKHAAIGLSSAFQHMTDKEQAWKNLLALTKVEDKDVRVSANYSLGKISIYRATEAESEERLKEEMDNAIGYFEKSSQESLYFNPAEFCLPFYRSYNAIISRKEEAEEEIEKNLEEAKRVVAGSKSKEKLLEAVENLANALHEAQKLRGLDKIQSDLNAYRRYCDRTVELLDETEDKAPGAAKLMRRGLPIIDERIKGILNEVEENAKKFCKDTQQTPLKTISENIFENAKGLSNEQSWINADKILNEMVPLIISMCTILPEESKSAICNQLTEIKHAEMDYKGTVIVRLSQN